MKVDYPTYLDGLLTAVADKQTGPELKAVNLRPLHEQLFPTAPETWLASAATALHKAGYGVDWQSSDNTSFLIDGLGLKRVAEIRKARLDRSLVGRLRSIPLGKGIWDIIKIGLGFFLGLLTHKITGS